VILAANEKIAFELQRHSSENTIASLPEVTLINTWVGIVVNHLVGPYVLSGFLNVDSYFQFLSEVLPELVKEIPLAIRWKMWYLHGGAPTHYVQNASQAIRENIGILNRILLSWTRRTEKLALQTMASISSNFFDVSFYAFTHNYSIFTLLFNPLLSSE
jgi:hypothetical protein